MIVCGGCHCRFKLDVASGDADDGSAASKEGRDGNLDGGDDTSTIIAIVVVVLIVVMIVAGIIIFIWARNNEKWCFAPKADPQPPKVEVKHDLDSTLAQGHHPRSMQSAHHSCLQC